MRKNAVNMKKKHALQILNSEMTMSLSGCGYREYCICNLKTVSCVICSQIKLVMAKPTPVSLVRWYFHWYGSIALTWYETIDIVMIFCCGVIYIRGCSQITSAKNRGSYTPPPPSVSNGQHLACPPTPSSAFVSIFPPALLYYNFRRRLFDMIKWGIFIC